jgi:tape measure domain-containing protein
MAAPELRLEVSLNLLGFRNEIRKLTNIAQSEFVPKINVKFNRQTLDAELNNLQRAIKRRVYRVEIGGNIDALPGKIKNLKEQLASIESLKIDLGIGAVKSLAKKDASKIKSDLRAEILGEQKKLYIPTSIQPKISRDDVRDFKNAVKSKLTGLSADVKVNAKGGGFAGSEQGAAGLMQYMRSQGMVGKTASGMEMRLGKGGDDIKQQLSDAVRSAEKIKSVFDGVAKNIATTGKSIASVQGKRLGLANVPLMAGAMEKRIERSASAIEGTTSSDALKALYPDINKTIVSLAALRGQVQQNTSKLSGFSLIIGLAAFAGVPLAKSIVKLTGSADKFSKLLDKLGPRLEAALTKAASNILNTTSSRLLSGGSVAGLLSAGSVAGLLPPAYRGIGPSAGPAGLLPPAYRGIGPSAKPAGLLPPAYRGIGPSAEPAGLLPPAYRGIGPSRNAGALPPAYRGLPFGFDFKGLPPDASAEDQAGGLGPTVQQMRQQLFSSIRIAEVRVREIFDIVGDFDSRQKAAGQAKLDKAVQDFVKGLEDIARRAILRGGVRQVNVDDLGGTVRPALPSGRSPLLLPPAGGTTAVDRIRVSTGAYLGQPGFMQAPSMPSVSRQPLTGQSTPLASPLGSGYFAVGKGLKDIQSAYGQAKKFLDTSRFPVAGAITGLGSEFGNAMKQVLLFGTAYKALAFLTSLPGEAFEAAKGLATYKNQLQAVTAESGTFEQSFAFVDGLAARFNVPLDSARQGFIKLYASMEPAGFDQGQIEGLFTGISKASAAFGLSADKVDRVNYAFAQMASKGQIMSEELKGQLGDVLPGALGLFAEAAQMSIPEFSKAMEDGAFKGKAMEQVLGNVSILLNTKFGPAAEGAAKTLQGAVNQIQNNLSLMYQAFAPIVDGVAAAFGPQVNSLIKDVTDTVKVLTTTLVGGGDGFDTLSPRAQAFYAAVQTLEPALRQAGAALTDLGSRLAALAPYFVQVLASVISFASSPLARAALIAALAIGTLTAAMKLLEVTGIKAVLKSIYTFIGTLTTGIPVACGIARVAVIGLKLVITGLFAGAVLIGLDFLVGKLLRIGDAAHDSAKDILGMRKELDAMAGAGDIESTSKAYLDANTKLAAARKANQKALNDLRAAKARPEGDTQADINKGVAVANAQTKVDQTYTKVIEAQKEVQAARRSRASAVSVQEGQKEQTQAALQEVDLSAGDGTKPPKGGKERESQIPQLTLALEKTKELSGIEMLIVNAQLMSNTAQLSSLELLKQLVEFKYEAKALGLDDLTTEERALKYKEISLRREQAIFENQLQLQISLKKERDEIQQGFSATLAGYQQEANYQQMYLDLINQGVLPSLAKVRVEAEKAFAEGEKQLNQSIEQQEANIAGLEVTIKALKLEKNLTLEKQEQLEAAENTLKTLKEDLRLRGLLKGTAPERKDAAIDAAERGLAPKTVQEYISEGTEAAEDRLRELMNTGYQVVQAANAIGDAFGTAFKGLVSGSMTAQEALAGLFQSIADSFADMVAQMIAEWLKMQLIKGIQSLLNIFAPGGDPGGKAVGTGQGIFTAANGGIAPGGFTAFANGGIVTGPTLGLVGEGRYNEAVIPLPDGKSVPVDLGGMAGGMGGEVTSNIVVNINNGQMQGNGNSNGSELGRKIEGAVKQVLVSELRPGGILSGGRR